MGEGVRTRSVFTYFHNVVASLLIVSGIGFVGVGIYMRVSRAKADIDLLYVSNSFWSTAFTMANLVIGLGVVCAVASVLAIIAMRKTFGIDRRVSKAAYCATLIVLIIWTGFVAFTGLSIVFGNMSALGLKKFVEGSWKRTVAEDPAKACVLQEKRECKVCLHVPSLDLRKLVLGREDNCLSQNFANPFSADTSCSDSRHVCLGILQIFLRRMRPIRRKLLYVR